MSSARLGSTEASQRAAVGGPSSQLETSGDPAPREGSAPEESRGLPERVRFEPFELDFDQQLLMKGERRVRLQPQPWKVLALLVRRAGRLVKREELFEELWGDRAVEADKGLNFCIRQVRTALGDRAGSPRFVETVPRRGYRFIAPVEPVSSLEVARDTPSAHSGPPARWGWAALVALVLVVAGTVTTLVLQRSKLQEHPPRLAFLPLTEEGGDEGAALVAAGLTHELINGLDRLDSDAIGLLSPAAARRFAGHPAPGPLLRTALQVDLLLRGNLQLEEGKARLHLSLETTEDQQLIWAQSFDAGAGALLVTQRELGERAIAAVAEELGVALQPASVRREDPRERRAYLLGQYLFEQGGKSVLDSVAHFEEAIAADPQSARAHAALAEALIQMGDRAAVEDRARQAAERALELEPNLASAHLSLAWIAAVYDWDWETAKRRAEQALELEPDSAQAHGNLSYLLLRRSGNEAAGLAEARRAQELDPVSVVTRCDVAWAYLYADRWQEAADQARETLELQPHDIYAALALIHASIKLGQSEEAVKAARELMTIRRASPEVIEEMSLEPEAGASMARFWSWWRGWLQRHAEKGLTFRDALASAAVEVGDVADALLQIEEAVEERLSFLAFLGVDPRFDALRGDPVFDELVERIEAGGRTEGRVASRAE